MAAVVHANIGLMHATMAVFNAWCDRMPLLLLGATGPVDAGNRRPWIDWIHSAQDKGALVRPYVKWDSQPASAAAAREALLRANWLANMAPKGPVYINLDVQMQESALEHKPSLFGLNRYAPNTHYGASEAQILELASALRAAKKPLFLMGRVSRSGRGWNDRVALIEKIGAPVLTDLRVGASFPTNHPMHAGTVKLSPSETHVKLVREADLIVSLEWIDLAGILHQCCDGQPPAAKVVHVSLDHCLHNGWSMDHQALPPVDMLIPAEPEFVVGALCKTLAVDAPQTPARLPSTSATTDHDNKVEQADARPTIQDMARSLISALGSKTPSLLHTTIAWDENWWPLDWIGSSGGAGLGAGPGIAVGAAIALKDSDRFPVAVLGDGDFLMGATAVWTAVHSRIPLLIVIANNQSYFNDELHQERVAKMRGRPQENKWIGQSIADPAVDIAQMAQSQGAVGIGPVQSRSEVDAALRRAIEVVSRGGVAVVDVWVAPGYA